MNLFHYIAVCENAQVFFASFFSFFDILTKYYGNYIMLILEPCTKESVKARFLSLYLAYV